MSALILEPLLTSSPFGSSKRQVKKMTSSLSRNFLLLVFTFGTMGQAAAQEASTVEPRVEDVLRQMSNLLAKSSRFAFKAEEIVDEVLDSGFKAELSHTRTIALRRPGSVVTNVDGDAAHRSAWFDGKTVTVLDRQHNRYAVVDSQTIKSLGRKDTSPWNPAPSRFL